MIFVKNIKSVSDQEWSISEKYPGVRWKFLIDADFDGSSGLSLGFAEIAISAKPRDRPELPSKSASIKNFHLTPGYFSLIDHS